MHWTAYVHVGSRLATLPVVLLLILPGARAEVPEGARRLPPVFQPFGLPDGARPLEAYMTLRVNGEVGIPTPVPVDAGRTAEVSWDLGPVAGRPTGIWLRVRRESGFACSDALAEPGDVISRLEDGIAGSATISLPEIGPFYVLACMVRNDGAALRGVRYTGDWTNMVPVQHGRMSTLIGVEPPTWVAAPDLVVAGVTLIRHGPDRGRLLIWVDARPAAPGVPAPTGSFPYRVYVVPSDVAARHRRQDDVSSWSETRSHDGTGRVHDLGLVGHGDVITTIFRLADDQAYTVFVVVNPRHDPFTRGLLPGPEEPDPYYRESNFLNNHRVMTLDLGPGRLGRRAPADDVLDLWVESHGPGWALIGVRYTLWAHDAGRLSLRLYGVEVPGYSGPERPAAGRGPTLDQLLDVRGLELECASVESASRYADAFSGLNQTVRFLCRYRHPGIGLLDWIPLLRLMNASPDIDEARRSGNPLLREFDERLAGTEFGAEVWLEHSTSAGRIDRLAEKRFSFRTVFLGGGAPSLPPQLALGPVQVATGRVTPPDFWRRGWCFGAEGSRWPADFTFPIGLQTLVGFRRDYDPGADPLPCESQWTFVADGLVRFNLDLFDRADAARVERATLSFLRTGLPARNDCPTPTPSVQAANPGYESRSGPFPFYRGESRRLSLGIGPVLAPASPEPRRIAVDATALVRAWLEGRANSGFRLAQPGSGTDRMDFSCAAQYGDFRLTLEFLRP